MDSLLLLDQELLDGAQGLLQLANCGNSRTTDGKICKFRKLFFFFKRGNIVCVFMSPTHLSGDSTRNDKILLTSLIKAVLYEL